MVRRDGKKVRGIPTGALSLGGMPSGKSLKSSSPLMVKMVTYVYFTPVKEKGVYLLVCKTRLSISKVSSRPRLVLILSPSLGKS